MFTTFRSVEGDRTSQLNVEQGEEQDVMPLALHIRRLRQWYGETGLSQAELAKLAGVSPKSLYAHEHRRALPQVVESLLARSHSHSRCRSMRSSIRASSST